MVWNTEKCVNTHRLLNIEKWVNTCMDLFFLNTLATFIYVFFFYTKQIEIYMFTFRNNINSLITREKMSRKNSVFTDLIEFLMKKMYPFSVQKNILSPFVYFFFKLYPIKNSKSQDFYY